MKKTLLNRVTSLPFFSAVSSAYLKREPALKLLLTRGTGGSTAAKYPGLVSVFGCEGDKDAPVAFIDGSFLLRDRGNLLIGFGTTAFESKVQWYNAEGWLPCLVSAYKSYGFELKIESFADSVAIDGTEFEIVYSRMTVFNPSKEQRKMPRVSKSLTELSDGALKNFIGGGETLIRDYAVFADRFGESTPYPDPAELRHLGGFDEHYEKMKSYWVDRIKPLTRLTLPDKELENAYKAGFVYTMIVKDGFELRVGENGYDRVFDHDVIGIISMLIAMGDFRDFEEYAKTILMNMQYPDARWKYPWVFSQYLFKTGDSELVKKMFSGIKENARCVADDREVGGIMKPTCAIDSEGHWLVDNQSALTGLAAYKYICRTLGETAEYEWAAAEYESLLDAVNARLGETMKRFSIDYLPISLDEPNETGARSDVRDANWASMFLFGRWSWEAFLLCERQDGAMTDFIDKTYEHGFERRRSVEKSEENFGGYPHGFFCSAYNAGYGSAALRGNKHRSLAVRAYKYMVDNAQSGPFSWWEGIGFPDESSPWEHSHAAGGGGSCPHIWGQATASKALIDSLIAEKYDGTLIIGRGIPDDWLLPGKKLCVEGYPISGGRLTGYEITAGENTLEIIFDRYGEEFPISIELPVLLSKNFSCEGGEIKGDRSVLVTGNTERIIISF